MANEHETDYGLQDQKGRMLLQSYVAKTLSDRHQRLDTIRSNLQEFVGKTIGEAAKELTLPTMSAEETYAAMISVMLDPMSNEFATWMPCEIYELADENDTTGKRLIIGDSMVTILKQRPDLANRRIKRANEFFGDLVFRVAKEDGSGGQDETD